MLTEAGDPGEKKKRLSWWTTFGAVSVMERVWRSSSESYLRPLPARIGVSHRGKSRRLERVLVDFGCEHSFARAAGQLREHYGFQLGATAVREATLAHARRARRREEAATSRCFRLLPQQGAETVVAEADGSMICTVAAGGKRGGKRPREWKEMRLVAACQQGKTEAVYGAGFADVERTGRRWAHCARQAGWALESRIHVVGDGAGWVQAQSQEVFGKQSRFLTDFFHVSEYLAAAALAIVGANDARRWLKVQQRRLKRGKAAMVLEALAPFAEPPALSEEHAPVRAALRYLSNRSGQLDYPAAIQAGLPIGSGMIESGHKHVLQARLKKAGAAWLPENADVMAQLRVLRSNNQWESIWNLKQAA